VTGQVGILSYMVGTLMSFGWLVGPSEASVLRQAIFDVVANQVHTCWQHRLLEMHLPCPT